jgi:hypothetical protein
MNRPELATSLERRQALATLLGLGGSWQASLQSSIVAFAPLVTAVIGTAPSSK